MSILESIYRINAERKLDFGTLRLVFGRLIHSKRVERRLLPIQFKRRDVEKACSKCGISANECVSNDCPDSELHLKRYILTAMSKEYISLFYVDEICLSKIP